MTEVSPDPVSHRGLPTTEGSPVSGAALRCEVITDFGQLESLFPEWQRLWETDRRAEIFQTPAWAKAWWRAFASECSLCVVAVYDNEELVGIAPFVKRADTVQFLGTPQADYADIICEENRTLDVVSAALDTLIERVRWDECSFQHLARHSRFAGYNQQLPARLRRCLHVVPAENYRTIVLRKGREEIFKELLGKQHTRRRQNKLQKAGKLQFRYLEDKAEAQRYLEQFFRHHVRRMAVIGKKSACARVAFCNFLRALVDELDLADTLRFAVLELNGRPLAWSFGFEVNGKFVLYQHTFDVDAWDYTPGEVLLSKLLEYAKGNIAREFDFGSGAEAYKNRFTNYERATCHVFFQRPGVVGLTRGLVRQAQGRSRLAGSDLKRTIQEHRPALTALRSFRSRTAEFLDGAREPGKNQGLLKQGFSLNGRAKHGLDVFEPGNSVGSTKDSETCGEEVRIEVGSFGDLVDLAMERSGLVTLSELSRCRQRLKRGDHVYLARKQSQVTLLSWVATNPSTNGLMHGSADDPKVDRPLMFMDECKAAGQLTSPASYRELLSFVALEAARRNSALRIGCRKDQTLLRSELLRQGFLLRS